MIRPLRRGIISRATRCRQKNTPLALTRWMRSQSASVRSMMSARRVTPALFTRMSIWPNAASASLHHAVDFVAGRRHPPALRAARRWPAMIASAAAAALARSMSATTTWAPASASATADGLADALAGAGHQRDLIGQVHAVFLLGACSEAAIGARVYRGVTGSGGGGYPTSLNPTTAKW